MRELFRKEDAMRGLSRNVGPSLRRTLLVLAGLHFAMNVLRFAVRHLAFEDLMVLILLLALVGMCAGAILGLAWRKRHAFAAALIAHGFIVLDARYLHQSLVSAGKVMGAIPNISSVDAVALPILFIGWCAFLAVQLGLSNLIARGLARGWQTPLWGMPEPKIFALPGQRPAVGSKSA